ncbi:MAG: hypothetical protein ACYDGR_04540 [Candidatus Dormibacteria bacterium]
MDAADPDRLLPGENPGTHSLEDARHWVSVYGELLGFKKQIIAGTQQSMDGFDEEAARVEVAHTDEKVLEAERQRFERRFRFWTKREEELQAT